MIMGRTLPSVRFSSFFASPQSSPSDGLEFISVVARIPFLLFAWLLVF